MCIILYGSNRRRGTSKCYNAKLGNCDVNFSVPVSTQADHVGTAGIVNCWGIELLHMAVSCLVLYNCLATLHAPHNCLAALRAPE